MKQECLGRIFCYKNETFQNAPKPLWPLVMRFCLHGFLSHLTVHIGQILSPLAALLPLRLGRLGRLVGLRLLHAINRHVRHAMLLFYFSI